MKFCYGYSGDMIVEAACGKVVKGGYGTDYRHGCCTPYNYCNVDGTCSYEIWEICGAAKVYDQCTWYRWDITECAKKYQQEAPLLLDLLIYGREGTAYYQRWCSTCNNPPGEERCGPFVMIVAQPR
jgi:hypothetical protein